MGLLHDLDDGRKREISEDDYDYFLGVLPPVAYRFTWNGERWGFGFAEGADHIYAFKKDGNRFFAQKTNLMNPYECGVPLEVQLQQSAQHSAQENKRPGRGAAWIPTWIKLGNRYPRLKLAKDPSFNTQSFHECQDDGELLDKLAQGNWPLGHAFYLGEACFIQLDPGGDEWLAIRRDEPVKSIQFSRVIRDRGRQAGQHLLDQIRGVGNERRCAPDR